jgi:DNA-binding MarR family transcriptional regulator
MTPDSQQSPAQNALKKFRVIFSAVRQHFRAVERACGVSGAQVWVMAVLAEHPGLRVSRLAEALAVHQSTASNLLDKMEHAGLVRRERGHKDQRVVEVYLTEAGLAALGRAPHPFTGVLPFALEQLSEGALARLNEDLDTVILHLHSADARAGDLPLSEL